jgi:hypothetical protein
MKSLRLVAALAVLAAACDAPAPSEPRPPVRSTVEPFPNPENAPGCDTACHPRFPALGGGGS